MMELTELIERELEE